MTTRALLACVLLLGLGPACKTTPRRDDRIAVQSPSHGGLRLTARALVAVPQKDHGVFLTWRSLDQDGADTAFTVLRAPAATAPYASVGQTGRTTTFRDLPGPGTFFYKVVPAGGAFAGTRSNVARVTTAPVGRDWVELMPSATGRKLQFSDRHFADTDGDGELEFVTYYPRVPSYRGGVASESYKIQVFELFEDGPPRWTFDTGMGLQREPFAEGDKRMDWDYEWTFKPVAWDIDGDFKAEIVTLAKRDGRYEYVVLKDAGDHADVAGALPSPIPVGVQENNNRHFPFFAYLGGRGYSFLLQQGTYDYWEMWAYDWNGRGFDPRWHLRSTDPGFPGNRSSSHSITVMDMDGDGRDEISNGATIIDDDGRVVWAANEFFGPSSHVDGQVIDDIDPRNPGLELMIHEERTYQPQKKEGDRYALYDLRSGRTLWAKHAPGAHLQLNVAVDVSGGGGLDVLGTFGGHKPRGAFATGFDGRELAFPFEELPLNGDRIWSMDWDGAGGRQTCLNFTKIYGRGGKLLHEVDLADAPPGDVIPWTDDKLHHLWFNVDLVGDHREDIPVQMRDGSVRVYLNTAEPPGKRKSKWQSRSYQMMQAPGAYRYFIAAHD